MVEGNQEKVERELEKGFCHGQTTFRHGIYPGDAGTKMVERGQKKVARQLEKWFFLRLFYVLLNSPLFAMASAPETLARKW